MNIDKINAGISSVFTSGDLAASKDIKKNVVETVEAPGDSVTISDSRKAKTTFKSAETTQLSSIEKQATSKLPEHRGHRKAKWTILIYSGADTDLEKYQVKDAIEMEKIGSSAGLNLILQLDRGKRPSKISGSWKGARRFRIEKDSDHKNINSPVLEDLGQINMADPRNLTDFIKWGMEKYPALHYMLIIASHGDSWKGAIDDRSHKGWMKLPDIKKAITEAEEQAGKKLDILGFDACVMAGTEVAYQLKDTARYYIASEENESAEGWPYSRILSEKVLKSIQTALLMKLNLDPQDLAKKIVRESAKDQESLPTMTALDLSKMDKIGEACEKMSKAIIATDTPPRLLRELAEETQQFDEDTGTTDYRDHYHFCELIETSSDITDKKLKKAAGEVKKAISEAIMAEQHSEDYPDAFGISIHLPTKKMKRDSEYRKLDFPKETKWDKALDRFGKRG